jgi:hypothetical protein
VGNRSGRAGPVGGAGLSIRRLALAAPILAAASLAVATLAAEDLVGAELFLRPRGFFVGPGATITLPVFDGTFGASGQAIARARLIDLSLRGPGGRRPLDRATWTERDPRSTVRVTVGMPGTHVVGVALGPRPIGRASRAAAAKALLAVTDAAGHLLPAATLRAGSAATQPFGYDVEIVPLVDPYALAVGDTLPVQARVGGKPLARSAVRAGGTIGTSASPIPVQSLTTDAEGRADVRLTHDGHWFVAFVHRREAATRTAVADVSSGATLTFGLLPAGAR